MYWKYCKSKINSYKRADKNAITPPLNICKNTVFTTRASSTLQADIEDSRILWLMTMPDAGFGKEGRAMGLTELIFLKIQVNK